MNNEEIGRVGVACVIAALGAIAETQVGLCDGADVRVAIFWWLVMIVGCGTVIDAEKGTSRKVLLLGAAIVSSAFVSAAGFIIKVDLTESICMSAISPKHPSFVFLMAFIWLITSASIFLLSFSRPALTNILIKMSEEKTANQINNIEKALRAAISLLALIALLIKVG